MSVATASGSICECRADCLQSIKLDSLANSVLCFCRISLGLFLGHKNTSCISSARSPDFVSRAYCVSRLLLDILLGKTPGAVGSALGVLVAEGLADALLKRLVLFASAVSAVDDEVGAEFGIDLGLCLGLHHLDLVAVTAKLVERDGLGFENFRLLFDLDGMDRAVEHGSTDKKRRVNVEPHGQNLIFDLL